MKVAGRLVVLAVHGTTSEVGLRGRHRRRRGRGRRGGLLRLRRGRLGSSGVQSSNGGGERRRRYLAPVELLKHQRGGTVENNRAAVAHYSMNFSGLL